MNLSDTTAWRPLGAILLCLLLAGCGGLCTKHLFLYRDTEQKSAATANLALLIADAEWAKATLSLPPGYSATGARWKTDEMALNVEAYRLSIEKLEGKPIFQGWCLDRTRTYACEVRPGKRQALLRFDLSGDWGHEKITEEAALYLEPGGIYFLWPDAEAMQSRRFLLKVERLPEAYTVETRTRLIDWKRQRSKGMLD
jgi:hypothetical protein